MDKQRWKEFFALLDRADEVQLETIRDRIVEKLANLPLSMDEEVIHDLRKMKRMLDEELAVRGLFLDAK
jgi:hypothetical protein